MEFHDCLVYFFFLYFIGRFACLSLAVLVGAENLHHADEDVEEVELEGNALVDGVAAHDTTLSQTSMVQNLLDIVEREAAKDSQTTVQPDALGQREGADSSDRQQQRSEARHGDNRSTGQKRAANVQVLLLLSGGANNRQGTHHGDGVETSTGENRHRDKRQQRRNKGGLRGVEGSPQRILGDVVVGADGPGANHGAEAERKTANANNPRVGHHEAVDEAGADHLSGRQGNDADAQAGVQERAVKVLALKDGHAAVVARLSVEDGIDGHERAAKDGAADEQLPCARAAGSLLRNNDSVVDEAGASRLAKGAAGYCRRDDARCEEAAVGGRSLVLEAADGCSQGGLCDVGQAVRQALPEGECE